MSEWQRIEAPWRCRPSRDVQRLHDVFLTLDSVKKNHLILKWQIIKFTMVP